MGRNRNINPVNAKPLLSGLAKLGLSADIVENAFVIVNVPPKFRSPGLKGDTILTKLTDLITTIQAGVVPIPVEGGIIVGDGSTPSQYILIPPGMPGEVLTWNPPVDILYDFSTGPNGFVNVEGVPNDWAFQIFDGTWRSDGVTTFPLETSVLFKSLAVGGQTVTMRVKGDILQNGTPDLVAGSIKIYDGVSLIEEVAVTLLALAESPFDITFAPHLFVSTDGIRITASYTGPSTSTGVSTQIEEVQVQYASSLPSWAPNDGAGIGEAPQDGTPYSRQDAAWISAGGELYDGIDTEANILAKDPTASLGEVWWASDTKKDIRAITSAIAGDVWQDFVPADYVSDKDAWAMPETADGHHLDLGQETFIAGINADITGATALDPRVFAVAGINAGNEDLKDFIKVDSSDIAEGILFGMNTTEAAVGENTKITTFGQVNDVNTSGFAVNDVLYVDAITKGEVTNVKPATNAWLVGIVLKVDALTGIIEILASSAIDTSTPIIPAGFATSFLTGDLSATAPFYDALEDDKGIVATVTQTVLVDDNLTLPIPIDFLTIPLVSQETINVGNIQGAIEWEVNSANAVKQITVEIYHADAAGVVIDVVNGLPVGDLGVRPAVVLTSPIVDPASTTVTNTAIEGLLPTAFTALIGERFRYHVLFSKIGTTGGAQTFTLYQGNLHNSFIAVPKLFRLNDLLDVNITAPANDQVLTYDTASGTWQNKDSQGGGGGTPGGLQGAVQFNNAGAFAGEDTLFYWDSANNRLGISNNTPGTSLDITGGDEEIQGVTILRGSLAGAKLDFTSYTQGTLTDSVINFYTADGAASGQRMQIGGNGNIGVGIGFSSVAKFQITSPGENLWVRGAAAGIASINYIRFVDSDSTSLGWIGMGSASHNDLQIVSEANMRLHAAGITEVTVAPGVTTFVGKVAAGGASTFVDITASGNLIGGNISTAGTLGVTGTATMGVINAAGIVTATNFQLSSDQTLKENIIDIGGDAIKYKQFNFIGSLDTRFGVLAQQVQLVYPDVVDIDKNGKLKISYIDLLVREVAELNNKVAALEALH